MYWGTAATIGTAGIPLGSVYIQTGTASSSDYAGTSQFSQSSGTAYFATSSGQSGTAAYAASSGQSGTASALIAGAGSSGTIAIAGLTSIIVSNGIVTGWV